MRIKRIYHKIRSIFHWLPIIWGDEQWDSRYLFELIAFKLKLMEDHFNSDRAIVADAKKIAKEIHTCRLLCERLYLQEYDDMLGLVHHSIDFDDFVERLNRGQKTITCNLIGWTGNRWVQYEEYMIVQDLEYLFKIMKKHVRCWWD